MIHLVKNLPAMQETQETWVRSLGWEDPLVESMETYSSILEEGMATYSSFLEGKSQGQRTLAVYGVTKSWTRLKLLRSYSLQRVGQD